MTDQEFESWWEAQGQYTRAGGGDYEKSFAYQLLRHIRERQAVRLEGAASKGYVAGGTEFLYPEAGDHPAPLGVKIHILTQGGVCVDGHWRANAGFVAWAPLPKRNRVKEQSLVKGVTQDGSAG